MKSSSNRIIICCASFPPEIGGAPGRILNLALLLKKIGYSVTVITAMPNHPTGAIFPAYRGRIVCKETVQGIEVVRLWLIPANTGNWVIRGLSLLTQASSILIFAGPRIILGRARAVFVSSPPLLTSYLYGILAKLGRKRLLVNISDIWPLTAKELGVLKEGSLMRALKKMERFLYRRAVGITGQSQAILAHVAEHSETRKPLLLYRNLPVDKSRVYSSISAIPKTKKVLYAGVLGFAQGMLDICSNINFKDYDLELHVYGDGTERGEIAEILSAHPGNGIFLHPTVDANELSLIMGECAAMLIPLRSPIHGAVPSKLFTAVAHALPVLFCGGGEGEDLVEQYGLGWTSPPGDISGLRKMLETFSGMSDGELTMLREKIHETYEAEFNKTVQDNKFEVYLTEVLKSPSRPFPEGRR